MSEETREETTVKEGNKEENQGQREGKSSSGAQPKTWYPYITKAQLEKFLARLENKIPEQIDRDYVRAIIRTPSMIYRFLRGIEAMKLIDREQHPTPRLERLVTPELRKHTIAEILRDLYADLLQEWQESGETMNDDEMVGFFRNKTGMGRDSANKMKMFFKFLINEADFSEPPPMPAPKPEPEPAPEPSAPEPQAAQESSAPSPTPAPKPAQESSAPASKPAQEQPSSPPQTSQAPPPSKATQSSSKTQEAPQERTGRDRGRGDSRQSQRNASQSQPQSQSGPPPQPRSLNEVQKAYLQTLQSIVNVNIDGDWDDDMIRTVFDRLERLFDRIKRG